MANTEVRNEVVELRLTAEQKALFEQAGEAKGCGLADFILNCAEIIAPESLVPRVPIEGSTQDYLRMIEAILDPPEPNEALRRAARRHRELFGE